MDRRVVGPDVVLSRGAAAMHRWRRRLTIGIPGMFMAIFFVWPVAAIIARGASLRGLGETLSDRVLWRVAWFTLWQAGVSTLATLAIGLPVAAVLARCTFPGRRLVEGLLAVPFVLPTVVVATSFLALLPPGLHDTALAVIVAHVYFNLAVVVRTVAPAWRTLDPRLGDAAATLGAPPWKRWTAVTAPLLQPAVLAAGGIVFLFCFTSFGAVLILGGPRHRTLEVEMYRRTAQLLDLRGAAAVATFQLIALATVLMYAGYRQRRATLALRRSVARAPRRPLVAAVTLAPVLVFVAAPLVALMGRAGEWSILMSPRGRAAIGASVRTALTAGLIAAVIGGLGAIALSRRSRSSSVLETALVLPLGTSAVTIGFGMLITFNRAPFDLRGTTVIVPIAHALIGIPFVARLATAALRSIDPAQREAAAMLGANESKTWWNIDWPALRRSLFVGAGFAMAVSLGEFGASSFLVRRGSPTLPTLIGELLGRPGLTANRQAHALAVVLAVLAGGTMLLLDRFAGPS